VLLIVCVKPNYPHCNTSHHLLNPIVSFKSMQTPFLLINTFINLNFVTGESFGILWYYIF